MNDGLLLAEFLDYSEDLMINNPMEGLIPFKIWDHQEDVVSKVLKKKNIVSLSARQMGMTSLMLILSHWYAHTFPNKTIFYTSDTQTMLNIGREFIKQLDYTITYKVCNCDELVLENGSSILFKRSCIQNCCSLHVDMLLIDNAAFIDGWDGWWSNINGYIKKDGYCWVNSTPTDKTSWFYELWSNAKRSNKVRIPWSKHPNKNKNWYNTIKLSYPPENFKREILTIFV